MGSLVIGIIILSANLTWAVCYGHPLSWFITGFMALSVCHTAADYVKDRKAKR